MTRSERILFFGTPEFAVVILRALQAEGWPIIGVVTQPDKPRGRRRLLQGPPVKEAALELGIPVWQPARVRDEAFLAECGRLKPQFIITAAYGQILPQRLLLLPTLGALNVHASLLPAYRGGAPIQWAIRNGEKETGVTLMTMVSRMDAGPMWASVRTPIAPEDTYGLLHDRLALAGARLLIDALPHIAVGVLLPTPQDEGAATYAPTLARQDEYLDFDRPARKVYDHLRSLVPTPGAFTRLGEKNLKIWYAVPADDRVIAGDPGKIVEVDRDGPVVACQTGAIILKEVQPEGGKRQSGAEFARGRRLVGLRCGEDATFARDEGV